MMALLAEASSPPTQDVSTWVLIVIAALGGGVLPILVSAYRRWKRGPLEDEEMVGRIVKGELGNMKDLLGEYRVEVELTKRQLEDYRSQLNEMTRELARAQVRIQHLEDELRTAREGRDELQRELAQLIAERDELRTERARLAGEAEKLRERLDRLEQFARDVDPERARPPTSVRP